MRRFDLVIFDLDGVLVDTSPCHSRAFKDLWQKVGIAGPPYEVIAGRTTKDVVTEFTAKLTPSPVQILEWVLFKQLQARQYLATQTIIYSDSISCPKVLARQEFQLALGTGASRDTTRLILKQLHLTEFFSIVVTGEDVKSGKPSPEVYLKIMAQAAVSPSRTLIIEDSSSGLEAAVRSKANVASVRTGKRVEAPRFVGSFADFHELLHRLSIAF